jgi:uncharacterized protein YjbJ (UPF0337 family)
MIYNNKGDLMSVQPTTIEKWPEIKTEIKKMWSKLSDQDLEGTKGDQKQVSTLLNSKYSDDKEKNSKQLSEIFSKNHSAKDASADKAKPTIKQ